ncbi:MAG: choice-of-anchor B family protein [bacterium]
MPRRSHSVIAMLRARIFAPAPLGLALTLALSAFSPALNHAAQPNTNMIELAHVDSYTQYNDCWGYRDPNTGVEYAILGTTTGTSILNITDPFNPYETGFIPGVQSIWRDVETYGDNLYVGTEGSGGGIQVIDLSNPEAPVLVRTKGTFSSHTIRIDEDAGILYCHGVTGGTPASGFRAFDLTASPDDPTVLANRATPYYHDGFTKNGRFYGASITGPGRVDVLRVTDMPAYSVMAIINYPQQYPGTHNVWTSEDGNWLYTTDEFLGAGTVRVWDVADTSSILQLNSFPVWPNTTVHNVYVKNDTAWCAWYEEGVLAFDVTDPLNEVQIASFDTGPDTMAIGPYAGCWAVYPFLPSGVIVSSDILQGLHLTYYSEQIGTVSGTVTNAMTGDPIPNAEVRVPGFFNRTILTDALGNYSVVLPGGSQQFIASATNYESDTSAVVVVDETIVDYDIALISQATGVGGSRESESAPPAAMRISASPNPAHGATTFALDLPRSEQVLLVVYDASGRRVRALTNGVLGAGRHSVAWDGRDDGGRAVGSGTFLTRLIAGVEARSTKVVLAR